MNVIAFLAIAWLMAAYVVVGLLTGLAFVVFGVTAVQSAPVSLGARVLLLPGAIALWPWIALRWIKSRRQP